MEVQQHVAHNDEVPVPTTPRPLGTSARKSGKQRFAVAETVLGESSRGRGSEPRGRPRSRASRYACHADGQRVLIRFGSAARPASLPRPPSRSSVTSTGSASSSRSSRSRRSGKSTKSTRSAKSAKSVQSARSAASGKSAKSARSRASAATVDSGRRRESSRAAEQFRAWLVNSPYGTRYGPL